MKNIIYHIDVNSAFPSWEAVYRLAHQGGTVDLREIPSAVGTEEMPELGSGASQLPFASDFKKPDRVHTLYPEEIQQKMWLLPVSELFFVGRATAKKLFSVGIKSVGELAVVDNANIDN